MQNLILFLILFFLFLIFYQIFNKLFIDYDYGYPYLREGLATNINNIQEDPSGNSVALTNLEKEVHDLSGNVTNLQTQVDGLVIAKIQFATQTAPAPPNISLQSVS